MMRWERTVSRDKSLIRGAAGFIMPCVTEVMVWVAPHLLILPMTVKRSWFRRCQATGRAGTSHSRSLLVSAARVSGFDN